MGTKAIIYVSDGGEADRWLDECTRYCGKRRYEIEAVVIDNARGERWTDALNLVTEGRAEVIVVARHDHLPADRPGRIEVVADQMTRQRRPTLRDEADRQPPRPSAGR